MTNCDDTWRNNSKNAPTKTKITDRKPFLRIWFFGVEQVLNQFVHQRALDCQVGKLTTQSVRIDTDGWDKAILDGNDRNSALFSNYNVNLTVSSWMLDRLLLVYQNGWTDGGAHNKDSMDTKIRKYWHRLFSKPVSTLFQGFHNFKVFIISLF